MRKHKLLSLILIALLIASAISVSFAVLPDSHVAQAQPGAVTYVIYATDGWWTMADGVQIYSYGFIGGRAGGNISYLNKLGGLMTATLPATISGGPLSAQELLFAGNAQFPAPLIYCAQGDLVTIYFKNLGVTQKTAPNDPHTIHLHGLDVNAANDGVPETSVAAIPANALLAGAGNVIVYAFTAPSAGTYFYHCHQEASIHVNMGMYGALIVYNQGEAGANSGPGSPGNLFGYNYRKDYVLLLSDTDILQHASEQAAQQRGRVFNPVNYKPQYWFINGLSFPNTIHAGLPTFNYGNWLAAHPGYDALIKGSVGSGDKVLLRMINMGFQTHPMHMHGFHAKVIGSDQRPWTWAQSTVTGEGLEKNTITIGSGETYELLLDFSTVQVASTYDARTQTRYNPASVPPNAPASNTQTGLPVIPDPLLVPPAPYLGGPTIPTGGTGIVGLAGYNSQIFVFHNHDDYKATNNGVYPGGMFTIIQPMP